MLNFLKKITKKKKDERFHFFDLGFHGDLYLISLVKLLLTQNDYFIETGTNVGSTLAFVAKTFPNIQCLSCEPDINAFKQASENISNHKNIELYNNSSQEFMELIANQKNWLFDKKVLFWLDAHGYGFTWPLKDEIAFITNNFKNACILVDDFKVPHLDCFKWDKFEGQECSFDYIKDSIKEDLHFSLYYPSYTDVTSKHHPLTGWGLILFGQNEEIQIPLDLTNKISRIL
jgi:hypothetical protein